MQKKPRNRRNRFVSTHAIERLRERVTALDLNYRMDIDLEQWLDASVENAIRRGDVEAIMDRGKPARLVNITKDLDAPAFALVKSDRHKAGSFSEVVITVMDDIMVASFKKGRWRDDKFRPLAEGLAKIKLAPEPDPETGRTQCSVTNRSNTPKPLDDSFLFSYVGEAGVTYELVPRAKVKHQLAQLALDPEVDEETIRVWREVRSSVKVSVEVDL